MERNHPDIKFNQRVLHFILPAYNEEASIQDLIERIAFVCNKNDYRYDILVIDDGSQDRTSEITEKLSKSLPVTTLKNSPNKGLGFTIRRGLKYATEHARKNDFIITLDSDLTQDPIYVKDMITQSLNGADVVIASRYRRGSGTEGLAYYRHMLSIGASLFMFTLCPIKGVRDYSCGFRMYKPEILEWGFNQYGEEFVSESGFACMVEIAARLNGKATFSEIPFVLKYDEKRKPSEMKILKTIKAYIRVMKKVKSPTT